MCCLDQCMLSWSLCQKVISLDCKHVTKGPIRWLYQHSDQPGTLSIVSGANSTKRLKKRASTLRLSFAASSQIENTCWHLASLHATCTYVPRAGSFASGGNSNQRQTSRARARMTWKMVGGLRSIGSAWRLLTLKRARTMGNVCRWIGMGSGWLGVIGRVRRMDGGLIIMWGRRSLL